VIDPYQPIDALRSCRTTDPDASRSASTKLSFGAYGERPQKSTFVSLPESRRSIRQARAFGPRPTEALEDPSTLAHLRDLAAALGIGQGTDLAPLAPDPKNLFSSLLTAGDRTAADAGDIRARTDLVISV